MFTLISLPIANSSGQVFKRQLPCVFPGPEAASAGPEAALTKCRWLKGSPSKPRFVHPQVCTFLAEGMLQEPLGSATCAVPSTGLVNPQSREERGSLGKSQSHCWGCAWRHYFEILNMFTLRVGFGQGESMVLQFNYEIANASLYGLCFFQVSHCLLLLPQMWLGKDWLYFWLKQTPVILLQTNLPPSYVVYAVLCHS